jgi:hypothetical protein
MMREIGRGGIARHPHVRQGLFSILCVSCGDASMRCLMKKAMSKKDQAEAEKPGNLP